MIARRFLIILFVPPPCHRRRDTLLRFERFFTGVQGCEDLADFFEANDCTTTDRPQIASVGYTMSADVRRYIGWVQWSGTTLELAWFSFVAWVIYSHEGGMGSISMLLR